MKKCEQCGTETKNPRFCGLSCSTKSKVKKETERRIEKYNLNPKKCLECDVILEYDSRHKKFCCGTCRARNHNRVRPRIWTEEQKVKSRKSLSKLLQQKEKYSYTKIYLNKCVICEKEYYNHNKSRKTCSTKCYSKHLSNSSKNNSNIGGYKHTSQLKTEKSMYKGYYMDSGAELYFSKLLDKIGMKWIKNDIQWKKYYQYVDETGKKRKYYPDFYLPQQNIWVEIKGKRYKTKNLDKKLRYVPGTIHLVMYNKIKEFVESLEINSKNSTN